MVDCENVDLHFESDVKTAAVQLRGTFQQLKTTKNSLSAQGLTMNQARSDANPAYLNDSHMKSDGTQFTSSTVTSSTKEKSSRFEEHFRAELSRVLSKHIMQWSANDVATWMKAAVFPQRKHVCEQLNIDGKALLNFGIDFFKKGVRKTCAERDELDKEFRSFWRRRLLSQEVTNWTSNDVKNWVASMGYIYGSEIRNMSGQTLLTISEAELHSSSMAPDLVQHILRLQHLSSELTGETLTAPYAWTGVQLAEWFELHGFAQYKSHIVKNCVEGETCLLMDCKSLHSEFGVSSLLHQMEIIHDLNSYSLKYLAQKRHVHWNPKDVVLWLKANGFQGLITKFLDANIDGAQLLKLSRTRMKYNLGINSGPLRLKLLTKLEDLANNYIETKQCAYSTTEQTDKTTEKRVSSLNKEVARREVRSAKLSQMAAVAHLAAEGAQQSVKQLRGQINELSSKFRCKRQNRSIAERAPWRHTGDYIDYTTADSTSLFYSCDEMFKPPVQHKTKIHNKKSSRLDGLEKSGFEGRLASYTEAWIRKRKEANCQTSKPKSASKIQDQLNEASFMQRYSQDLEKRLMRQKAFNEKSATHFNDLKETESFFCEQLGWLDLEETTYQSALSALLLRARKAKRVAAGDMIPNENEVPDILDGLADKAMSRSQTTVELIQGDTMCRAELCATKLTPSGFEFALLQDGKVAKRDKHSNIWREDKSILAREFYELHGVSSSLHNLTKVGLEEAVVLLASLSTKALLELHHKPISAQKVAVYRAIRTQIFIRNMEHDLLERKVKLENMK